MGTALAWTWALLCVLHNCLASLGLSLAFPQSRRVHLLSSYSMPEPIPGCRVSGAHDR